MSARATMSLDMNPYIRTSILTNSTTAEEYTVDFDNGNTADGMSAVVHCELFSHGVEWASICRQFRNKQGHGVDGRLSANVWRANPFTPRAEAIVDTNALYTDLFLYMLLKDHRQCQWLCSLQFVHPVSS